MPSPEVDFHHPFHYRREWELRPESKRIRNNQWLVVPLARTVHNALHKDCPPVPLLPYHTMQRVANNFEPVPNDYLASLDNVLETIDQAIQHPKVTSIEAQVSRLTMRAVEMQLPFIKRGLVWG